MNNNITIFIIFWGIWILMPILIDGTLAAVQMFVVLIWGRDFKKHEIPKAELPLVSVIIPTHNEEEHIHQCLNFLKIQTYPHEKMEIIVVDNGSGDRTRQIVDEHIENHANHWSRPESYHHKIKIHGVTYEIGEFEGVIELATREEKSKAKALNEGITRARGDIIINIDCRSFLAPDAINNMVAKFIEEPDLDACTGNIEINWHFIYEKDQTGKPAIDEKGYLKSKFLSVKEAFLAKCQFLEYLVSFRLGRQFQDITRSMYTLSGAFSAFRRETLYTLYSAESVSEDTDLTLGLQRKHRIGYAADAKAYLKPITNFERLYAQRIRWQRGELEVFGLHQKMLMTRKYGFFKMIFYPLTLSIDHTFAFPRLIWTFLLPLLFLFGYSPTLIGIAILLMVGFYIALDFVNTLCCYSIVDKDTKKQIRGTIHYNFVMWFYRLIVFYFRVSASLIVLKEPPEWMVRSNPISSVKKGVNGVKAAFFNFRTGLKSIWSENFTSILAKRRQSGTVPSSSQKKYSDALDEVPSLARENPIKAEINDEAENFDESSLNENADNASSRFKQAWEAAKAAEYIEKTYEE